MVCLLFLSSCAGEEVTEPERFAMEAWIDSDGYPVVILERALSPTTRPIEIKDMMVRWAKVTISDGERTEIMTGGVDPSVFPPFSYRTFKIKGEVGRTYRVEAAYEGVRASAVSTILQPGEITDVRFRPINDSLFSASVTYRGPATDDTCRYVLMSRVRGIDSRHYPSMLGTLTTTSACQSGAAPLYRGRHVDSLDPYEANFRRGDTIEVALARVEPSVFRFWDAYQNEVYFGNNIFISSYSPLQGNVDGGYGIFSARGVSRRQVVVK